MNCNNGVNVIGLERSVRKWRPPRLTDDITPLLRIFDPQAVLPARYVAALIDGALTMCAITRMCS